MRSQGSPFVRWDLLVHRLPGYPQCCVELLPVCQQGDASEKEATFLLKLSEVIARLRPTVTIDDFRSVVDSVMRDILGCDEVGISTQPQRLAVGDHGWRVVADAHAPVVSLVDDGHPLDAPAPWLQAGATPDERAQISARGCSAMVRVKLSDGQVPWGQVTGY